MKLRILLLLCVATAIPCVKVFADASGTSVVPLKDRLHTLLSDLHPIGCNLESLAIDAGCGSNQLVTAAKEVFAETADTRIRRRSLTIVSKYGTTNEIGFLVASANDSRCWKTSANGIINLLGPTSNAVSDLSILMSMPCLSNDVATLAKDKGTVVEQLMAKSRRASLPPADVAAVWRFSYAFASNYVGQTESIDRALVGFDATYEHSLRRLNMLRHQLANLNCEYLRGYVTNAINELVAYPETNLPE